MMITCLLDRLPMEAVCETTRLRINDCRGAAEMTHCIAFSKNAVLLRWLYDLWYVWRVGDERCSLCSGSCVAGDIHMWYGDRCDDHSEDMQWCNLDLCIWPTDEKSCAHMSRILDEHAATGPKRYNGLFFVRPRQKNNPRRVGRRCWYNMSRTYRRTSISSQKIQVS